MRQYPPGKLLTDQRDDSRGKRHAAVGAAAAASSQREHVNLDHTCFRPSSTTTTNSICFVNGAFFFDRERNPISLGEWSDALRQDNHGLFSSTFLLGSSHDGVLMTHP
jgi:hypothetical protein